MSTRALAAFARHFGRPLSLEEHEFPDPIEDNVLVRIEFPGICHTDLHALRADWSIKPTLPFVPGHEGTEVVYKVGPAVRDVKEGDRDGLPWLRHSCGACEWCLSGRETLCPKHSTVASRRMALSRNTASRRPHTSFRSQKC